MSVIRVMLSQSLRSLEKDPAYKEAVEVIKNLQTPLLTNLANSLKELLVEFLPNIKDVKIGIPENTRLSALRSEFEVIIDDGTPTSIEYKGDGVKSLAALSLLNAEIQRDGGSIIAIEEPESHLHPAAIHQLNEVITSLAEHNQVLLTTHNPLFVDRQNVEFNIIIDDGKAKPAKDIRTIRDLLGIKASDNLINARYVLVVEGENDVIALTALLSHSSTIIDKAIKDNLLIIDQIGGSGNLLYKLSLLNHALCEYHVVLDYDDAGRKAFDQAHAEDTKFMSKCSMIICNGMSSSELEDCFDLKVYKQAILKEFGVDISVKAFKNNSMWSERMRTVFLSAGKPWNDKVKNQLKSCVADCVRKKPSKALHSVKGNAISAIIDNLEKIIN